MWGAFTTYKKIKNREDVTAVEISIETNNYVEEYGLTEFNSRTLLDSHEVETNEFKDVAGLWGRTKRTPASELPYDLEKETAKLQE